MRASMDAVIDAGLGINVLSNLFPWWHAMNHNQNMDSIISSMCLLTHIWWQVLYGVFGNGCPKNSKEMYIDHMIDEAMERLGPKPFSRCLQWVFILNLRSHGMLYVKPATRYFATH
jgi:hypothetical protein